MTAFIIIIQSFVVQALYMCGASPNLAATYIYISNSAGLKLFAFLTINYTLLFFFKPSYVHNL